MYVQVSYYSCRHSAQKCPPSFFKRYIHLRDWESIPISTHVHLAKDFETAWKILSFWYLYIFCVSECLDCRQGVFDPPLSFPYPCINSLCFSFLCCFSAKLLWQYLLFSRRIRLTGNKMDDPTYSVPYLQLTCKVLR